MQIILRFFLVFVVVSLLLFLIYFQKNFKFQTFTAEDRECIRRGWQKNPLTNFTQDFGAHYRISFSDIQKDFKWLHLPPISTPSPEILLIVTSRCDNFSRRNILRKTLMKSENWRLRILFFVGLSLKIDRRTREVVLKEAELYGDMVVTDMEDTYEGLSYKTLSLLLYAVSKSPGTKLIGKVDEDIMLFPNQLISLIDSEFIKTNGSKIYGHIVKAGVAVDSQNVVVQSSKSSYGCPRYPEYLAGPIYLTTRIAAEKIINGSNHRKFLISEDTLITGLLADDVGVERVQLPYLEMFPDFVKDKKILAWHTKLDNDEYLKFYGNYLKS